MQNTIKFPVAKLNRKGFRKGYIMISCAADVLQIMRQYPEASTPEWPAMKERALNAGLKHRWFL
jgi:hypothetical protein